MPKRVKLPNGKIGVFPDEMDNAAIEAVLQKQFAPPAADPATAAAASEWAANPVPLPGTSGANAMTEAGLKTRQWLDKTLAGAKLPERPAPAFGAVRNNEPEGSEPQRLPTVDEITTAASVPGMAAIPSGLAAARAAMPAGVGGAVRSLATGGLLKWLVGPKTALAYKAAKLVGRVLPAAGEAAPAVAEAAPAVTPAITAAAPAVDKAAAAAKLEALLGNAVREGKLAAAAKEAGAGNRQLAEKILGDIQGEGVIP